MKHMSDAAQAERSAAAAVHGDCRDCDEHTMQCMEVWGGSHGSHSAVAMPGLEVWVYSRPHEGDDAGGDVHYVSSCGTGRITRLLLADVSGHGESAAKFADSLRDLMRKYVNYIDQTRFVETMNREFAEMASSEGQFATAIVATYWAPTGRLILSNAGHPRPCLYRAADRTWRVLRADAAPGLSNLPLGVASPTSYEELSLKLEEDDLLVLVSDALTEARSPDRRMLGEKGLLDALRALPVDEPDHLVQGLIDAATGHAERDTLDDDATVLIVRCTGDRSHRSPARNAPRAIRGMVTGMIDSIRKGKNLIPLPEMSLANVGGVLFDRFNRRVDVEEDDPSRRN